MKNLVCKVFALAAVAALLAVPAAAADSGVFRLGHAVTVGGHELPAGEYTFRAMERGVVLVYDASQANVVATAFTHRSALSLDQLETSGTLAHDWTVRTLSLGDFRYTFVAGEKPAALAALPAETTTVVAMAR